MQDDGPESLRRSKQREIEHVTRTHSDIQSDYEQDHLALKTISHLLKVLRDESDNLGELLATLMLPSNRAAFEAGNREAFKTLYDLLEGYNVHHHLRMATINPTLTRHGVLANEA